FDDHLLAHARNEHCAPVLARDALRDAHPASRAHSIPVKLHLDAAMLVGIDLPTADDDRGLGALNYGFGCDTLRSKRLIRLHGPEAHLKIRTASAAGELIDVRVDCRGNGQILG